jgi:hypothetical protein
MRMPGFGAEASLFVGSRWATVVPGNNLEPLASTVQPARISGCLQTCDQICEGDIIGACMPWCICRCHGGSNCGHPS